ncbi:Cytoskeleton protein RodZ [Halomonas sp. THAF5a]|uniref:RodZ domain-containing protein n=1 Tax=Halomonas sp. THAF5a TaxID=2587844 RepID=UPI0012689E5E|nr:RodZ domain-containing protein [Halomonas sp. THAF5a]QFU02984.1 Cytoskeleton protein RodZ [Halomonas sp. THAF5a]
MSDIHNDAAAETSPRLASPGELLRRERESQGLDRDEVADALNLRPAVIEGLENDHYEEVPVAAYRRGYLRSYAQLLGLDDRAILDAYRTHFGSEEQESRVTPVHVVNKPPSRLGTWLFRLVTLLVIAGMIGLTLMWWQSRGGSQPPTPGDSGPVAVDSLDGSTTITEEPGAEADDLPPLPEGEAALGLVDETSDEGQAATAADDAQAPAEGEAEPAVADAAAATAESATQTADADEAPTAETDAAAGEPEAEAASEAVDRGVLELTFNEQSWTEIFDADNQRIFVGLQQPGTSARVEGTPPFRLTVGNATGVELNWGGEPVDLTARAGANNVARFTLGE